MRPLGVQGDQFPVRVPDDQTRSLGTDFGDGLRSTADDTL